MNVLIIGATGKTGRIVTEQLVKQNRHSITVLVRRPEAMKEYASKVTILKGDATKLEILRGALHNQDAVISTLGTRSLKSTNLETDFIYNLIKLVKKNPIRRFINLSAWGAGGSADHNYLFMKIARRSLLKNMYDDKDRGEALLFASDLAYVNVRPSRLTNGSRRGKAMASLDGKKTTHSISRADVADFLVDQLESDRWLYQSPLIGYAK